MSRTAKRVADASAPVSPHIQEELNALLESIAKKQTAVALAHTGLQYLNLYAGGAMVPSVVVRVLFPYGPGTARELGERRRALEPFVDALMASINALSKTKRGPLAAILSKAGLRKVLLQTCGDSRYRKRQNE